MAAFKDGEASGEARGEARGEERGRTEATTKKIKNLVEVYLHQMLKKNLLIMI